MSAIDAGVNRKRKPGLQAQVQQTQLLVQKIEIIVQALARFQTQHQLLLLPVPARKISQTGLHHAPNTNQTAGQAITTRQLSGQHFLALGTALQIAQRATRPLGQLMCRRTHTLGPTPSKGGEVFQQNPYPYQISLHQTGLVKRTQCRHKSNAVKTRKNADDIGRVLSYKRRRGVVGRGSDFDFHTNVLLHQRRPVCSSLWLRLCRARFICVHPWFKLHFGDVPRIVGIESGSPVVHQTG